jgi:hypothetical protein
MPERMKPIGTGQRFLTIAEVSELLAFHSVTLRGSTKQFRGVGARNIRRQHEPA